MGRETYFTWLEVSTHAFSRKIEIFTGNNLGYTPNEMQKLQVYNMSISSIEVLLKCKCK
jgi:hypothetical protein